MALSLFTGSLQAIHTALSLLTYHQDEIDEEAIMNARSISITLLVFGIALVAIATACSSAAVPPASTASPTSVASETPTAAASKTPSARSQNTGNPTTQPSAGLPANLKSLGLEGGLVAANAGNELSLRIGKATQQLPVSSSTLVAIPGKTNAQISDIKIGDRVIADVGQGDASTPARFVLDIPQGYTTQNVVAGAVVTSGKSGIQVRARNGNEQVNADSSAVIINMTGNQAKLGTVADAKRGTGVLVIGQPDNGSMDAQVVVVVDRSTLQGRRNNAGGTPTTTP